MQLTLYAIIKNLHMVKSNSEANFAIEQKWFYEYHMVLMPLHINRES